VKRETKDNGFGPKRNGKMIEYVQQHIELESPDTLEVWMASGVVTIELDDLLRPFRVVLNVRTEEPARLRRLRRAGAPEARTEND